MSMIRTQVEGRVGSLILNRPEVHNAFNDELMNEMMAGFKELENNEAVSVVVLSGEGKSFCAGADLKWMKSMVNYSVEENIEDSKKLDELFFYLNNFSKPLIGKINGAALGGGVGLVAVCDFAITHEKSRFGFTEVRLGLVPAVISPYCIRKIGESQARAWFLSGELFSAHQAQKMNLIHEVTSVEDFEQRVEAITQSFLKAAPGAARAAKQLVKQLTVKEEYRDYTVKLISERRVSLEGQEGMNALLEKRAANWMES